MRINIKATDIELTKEISDYLSKKISGLEKFAADSEEAYANIEIGRSTNHHRTGNVFFTEINFRTGKNDLRAKAFGDSLMSSMDRAKDIALEIAAKDKEKTHNL